MNRNIDQYIIEKFQNGDQKAFRIIFDILYPIFFSFARKYSNDSNETEDMVQEAFIALWNEKDKFRNADQVKAFLYVLIRNKSLNRIKHLKIKEDYTRHDIAENNNVPCFEEEIIRIEYLAHIKSMVDRLPKKRRKIILLSMSGYKNMEIAEELNISANTVKLQKKIAYQQLRENLSSSLLVCFLMTVFFS